MAACPSPSDAPSDESSDRPASGSDEMRDRDAFEARGGAVDEPLRAEDGLRDELREEAERGESDQGAGRPIVRTTPGLEQRRREPRRGDAGRPAVGGERRLGERDRERDRRHREESREQQGAAGAELGERADGSEGDGIPEPVAGAEVREVAGEERAKRARVESGAGTSPLRPLRCAGQEGRGRGGEQPGRGEPGPLAAVSSRHDPRSTLDPRHAVRREAIRRVRTTATASKPAITTTQPSRAPPPLPDLPAAGAACGKAGCSVSTR